MFSIFQYSKQHSNEHLHPYIFTSLPHFSFCFESVPGGVAARSEGAFIHVAQSSKSISQFFIPPAVCENASFFFVSFFFVFFFSLPWLTNK